VEELTATEAARAFRALLDRVEREGAGFRIVRHGRAVAELGPVRRSTAGDLRARLRREPPDPDWLDDIRFARELPERVPPS
jgi:antitoxin (DNA-binding transcriptional repressor) of toxin-antitoxin stability system